jgi:serpin B
MMLRIPPRMRVGSAYSAEMPRDRPRVRASRAMGAPYVPLLLGVMSILCACRPEKREGAGVASLTPPLGTSSEASAPESSQPMDASTLGASSRAPWDPPPLGEGEQRGGNLNAAFSRSFDRPLREHALVDSRSSFVYSPLSLGSALALAYEGANGMTRAELARLLELSDADDVAGARALAALERAAPASGGESLRLHRAALLWVAHRPPNAPADFEPLPEFVSNARSFYGAEVLRGKTNGRGEDEINDWVQHATDGGISALIPRGELREDTRIVIASTLRMESPWAAPFPKERTANKPFTALDGKRINVRTMGATGARLVAIGEDYEAVDLILKESNHRLLIVAPRAGRFHAFEDALPIRLPQVLGATRPLKVDLELPAFRVESSLELGSALLAAGVRVALSSDADFSRMVSGPVFIDKVFQGAELEIDEDGIKASAATAIAFPPPSNQKPQAVKIDRPFLFFLHNWRSGAILFAGRFTGTDARRQ